MCLKLYTLDELYKSILIVFLIGPVALTNTIRYLLIHSMDSDTDKLTNIHTLNNSKSLLLSQYWMDLARQESPITLSISMWSLFKMSNNFKSLV